MSLRCLAAGSRLSTGIRRSCWISSSRSAASSLAIRPSTSATCSSERSRRNSTWCSSSSSSNTSASSSLSPPTASMISWPSSCEAASTRSAIWAGCRRRSRVETSFSRELGTCPTNGSMSRHEHELSVLSVVAPEAARQQPEQTHLERRIDAGHAPGPVLVHQLDVAGGHQPRGVDVDQAAIEHVGAEQHLSGPALELGQVELRRCGPRRGALQLLDAVHRHEQPAPTDVRYESDDRRQRVGAVEPHDHVLDLAQPLAVRVEQRATRNR